MVTLTKVLDVNCSGGVSYKICGNKHILITNLGLYTSTNLTNWEQKVDDDLSYGWIEESKIDSRYIVAAGKSGVYATSNYGTSWQKVFSVTQERAKVVIVDDRVFVASLEGLWASGFKNLTSWKLLCRTSPDEHTFTVSDLEVENDPVNRVTLCYDRWSRKVVLTYNGTVVYFDPFSDHYFLRFYKFSTNDPVLFYLGCAISLQWIAPICNAFTLKLSKGYFYMVFDVVNEAVYDYSGLASPFSLPAESDLLYPQKFYSCAISMDRSSRELPSYVPSLQDALYTDVVFCSAYWGLRYNAGRVRNAHYRTNLLLGRSSKEDSPHILRSSLYNDLGYSSTLTLPGWFKEDYVNHARALPLFNNANFYTATEYGIVCVRSGWEEMQFTWELLASSLGSDPLSYNYFPYWNYIVGVSPQNGGILLGSTNLWTLGDSLQFLNNFPCPTGNYVQGFNAKNKLLIVSDSGVYTVDIPIPYYLRYKVNNKKVSFLYNKIDSDVVRCLNYKGY